jgi:hypothetical protein
VKEGSLQTTIINIDPHSVVREYDKRIVNKNATNQTPLRFFSKKHGNNLSSPSLDFITVW